MNQKKTLKNMTIWIALLLMITIGIMSNPIPTNAASKSQLKISGNKKIGTYTEGSGISVSGTVSSNYYLSYVNAYILGADGKKVIYAGYSHKLNNTKKYNIKNSAPIKSLKFNKLVAGTYYFQVTARDSSGKALYLVKDKFVVKAKASTLKISGYHSIGSFWQGKTPEISGLVSSNYNLNYVNAYILDSAGKNVVYAGYSHQLNNQKKYELKNSTIIKQLKFDQLSPGTYYFQITSCDSSGKALYLIKEKFTVAKNKEASTLKISGHKSIGIITAGQNPVIQGIVSSNYNLNYVNAYILNSSGNGVIYGGYSHQLNNTKTYNLNNSSIIKSLQFCNLPAGTYYYQITAYDTSGTALYLVKERFSVRAGASKMLNFDWNKIRSVGKQSYAYTQSCACFSMAYCRTIIEDKTHYWYQYNVGSGGRNENASQYSANCDWSIGHYSQHYEITELETWQVVYNSLNSGNPVIVNVKGNGSTEHWVTIVGYQNVGSYYSLNANNFLFIDSVTGSEYKAKTLGGSGYTLKSKPKGTERYHYCTRD